MSYSNEEIESQNNQIIQLYRHRVSGKEISNRLGLPITTIRGRIHKLIKEGKIVSIRSRNVINNKKNGTQHIRKEKTEKVFKHLTDQELHRLLKVYINKGNLEKAIELIAYYENNNNLSEKKHKGIEEIKLIIQRRIDKSEIER